MNEMSNALLDWYDRHARQLPWRVPPADGKLGILANPYHVWLSEVMLQQTTVATVKDYFCKFVDKWPNVQALAACDEDDVLKAWAGLGYYSRARNLKKCADTVVAEYGGTFPSTQQELIKLPGIGPYTSAAIAAIAFGERAAVVDGNIERVVTLLEANSTPMPQAKLDCARFMERETPAHQPGDFAQAMMDLGATICTPRNPVCGLCPLSNFCRAREQGTMSEFPVKAPKKAKPVRKGAAFVLERPNGDIWLQKRPDKGLLAGMSEVPTTQWNSRQDGALGQVSAPFDANWILTGNVRHTFTHFHLELEVWYTTGVDENRPIEAGLSGWWSPITLVHSEALPTVMRKIIESAKIG